jgi:hypothetical protein
MTRENTDEHNGGGIDDLSASIDKAKSIRDAHLAKFRHERDAAIDTIMQSVPTATRVLEISDRLDAIRYPGADPYSIWNAGHEKAGILKEEQENNTRICGIGIMRSSFPGCNRTAIVLLPEQEYDHTPPFRKDIEHVHVKAGIYDASWYDGIPGMSISPLEYNDEEWDNVRMLGYCEDETYSLKMLVKSLATFENDYSNYARGLIAYITNKA